MLDTERVLLVHGSGGSQMKRLLDEIILKHFEQVQRNDAAVLLNNIPDKICFTSDSFVVHPWKFSGGNIGKLAVNGTVNDLAMLAAKPAVLSCSLIIEEGFIIDDLNQICRDMRDASEQAEVAIVTGDTKVVAKGEADGIFINTAGVGFISANYGLSPSRVQCGDQLLLNGGIGEHGTVIMAERLGISFDPLLNTDSMPLWPQVAALLKAGIIPKMMRDITRGGLAAILEELVPSENDFVIYEADIPIDCRVKQACGLWGIDPLYVASEGRFLAVIDTEQSGTALNILNSFSELKQQARVIGEVTEGSGKVVIKTKIGGARRMMPLETELLPRIC